MVDLLLITILEGFRGKSYPNLSMGKEGFIFIASYDLKELWDKQKKQTYLYIDVGGGKAPSSNPSFLKGK